MTVTKAPLYIVKGAQVAHCGELFTITHIISASEIIGLSKANGAKRVISTAEIEPVEPTGVEGEPSPPSRDLSDFTEQEWEEAKRRLDIIRPLLDPALHRTMKHVEKVSASAGVHYSTLYAWLRLYEQSGQLASLVPSRRGPKSGTKLVNADAEAIIEAVIKDVYLTPQKPRAKEVCIAVHDKCKAAGVVPPHPNTVRNRLNALPKAIVLGGRGRKDMARDKYQALKGRFPGADAPLSIVQIDHSKCDLVVVDEVHRKPIGRPWLTLAIDVYSRMVVGYYLSLEAPSATAAGMCLSTAILPKAPVLKELGIEGDWPVWGFMKVVHCDNAKEFRGKTLARACNNYTIDLHLRPVRVPHYGGHIERMMGTVAGELRKLPGATFSNPEERKGYSSDDTASFTLAEYERYLVDFIVNVYHQRVHTGIGMSPLRCWNLGLVGDDTRPGSGMPPMPTDTERIQIDFLPLIEKTVQRYGIQIDHLRYFDSCLEPWIGAVAPETGKKRTFVVRRDPRDISCIYFFDPHSKGYQRIPTRDLALPATSLAEYREARKRLIEEGQVVDEPLIARSIERLRQRAADAASKSKVARKQQEVHRSNRSRAQPVLGVRRSGGHDALNATVARSDSNLVTAATAEPFDASTVAPIVARRPPSPALDPFDEEVTPFDDVRVLSP